MDFKNKDKIEVSVYLSSAGIPDDICETFEGKQLNVLCLDIPEFRSGMNWTIRAVVGQYIRSFRASYLQNV